MKALTIVVPILLIGGAFGAAAMGVINVPGISPKKAAAKQPAEEEQKEAEPTEEDLVQDLEVTSDESSDEPVATESEQTMESQVTTDAVQGAKALAKYWDAIETRKLIPITDTFSEKELAQVLFYMQKAKVAELMSIIPADRAAKLSRELQRLASVVTESP